MVKFRLLVIVFVILYSACTDKKLAEGNKLIDKIEAYKTQHNKLPESLSGMGIKETMEGPLYYDKKDSVNYIVWYGTALGESMTYYSATKRWEDRQH